MVLVYPTIHVNTLRGVGERVIVDVLRNETPLLLWILTLIGDHILSIKLFPKLLQRENKKLNTSKSWLLSDFTGVGSL